MDKLWAKNGSATLCLCVWKRNTVVGGNVIKKNAFLVIQRPGKQFIKFQLQKKKREPKKQKPASLCFD